LNSAVHILFLEDDVPLGELVVQGLKQEGHQVTWVRSIAAAGKAVKERDFELYLVDLQLPDGFGLEWMQQLVQARPLALVLILSALADPETRLQALERGAYDFLGKPFALKELCIKIQRLWQSHQHLLSQHQEWSYGNLKIFFDRYEVQDALGKIHHLNHKECAILKLLHDQRNQVVARDYMIDQVWGEDAYPSPRTVDNYIVTLRKWCDSDPAKILQIQSVRGIGYILRCQKA
jgi:two-component system, OmpR family, alkaline phosphatase synthesis response regulator PhoP